MKRHILSFICLASIIACASSAVHDRGSKPSTEEPEEVDGSTCDEYDILCIEKNSLWPTNVSIEDILSESWESKRNALESSSRIRIVGRHVKNAEVEVRERDDDDRGSARRALAPPKKCPFFRSKSVLKNPRLLFYDSHTLIGGPLLRVVCCPSRHSDAYPPCRICAT